MHAQFAANRHSTETAIVYVVAYCICRLTYYYKTFIRVTTWRQKSESPRSYRQSTHLSNDSKHATPRQHIWLYQHVYLKHSREDDNNYNIPCNLLSTKKLLSKPLFQLKLLTQLQQKPRHVSCLASCQGALNSLLIIGHSYTPRHKNCLMTLDPHSHLYTSTNLSWRIVVCWLL